jgi:hypothetical protein
MTDPTPIPADDADDADERRVDDGAADERDVDDELAPEEELLGGWLPVAEPTDGPAPAP